MKISDKVLDKPVEIIFTESFVKIENIFEIVKQADAIEWKPLRSGIDIFPLYKSEDGASAALLRLHAGSTVPEHLHTGYENILVLSGFQTDDNNSYSTGDFVAFSPNSSHTVHSENGGIVLAIWTKPIKFL